MPGFYETLKGHAQFVQGFPKAISYPSSAVKKASVDVRECPVSLSDEPELLKYNEYKNSLRRIFYTENPAGSMKLDAVWDLSGRTSVLGRDIDRLQRPFDKWDDKERMLQAIRVADVENAYRVGKRVEELTDADRVVPIFYNGRPDHNDDLRAALKQGDVLPYPAHLFEIREIPTLDTLGQIQCFIDYVKEKGFKRIGVSTSGFHLARFSLGITKALEDAGLEDVVIVGYGIDREFQREGTSLDLESEPKAMYNYSTGFGRTKAPTIAPRAGSNIIKDNVDATFVKSLEKQKRDAAEYGRLEGKQGCVMC